MRSSVTYEVFPRTFIGKRPPNDLFDASFVKIDAGSEESHDT